jgi:hypothetical protein
MGVVISALLCGVTGMRLARTRKVMPSGLLLGVSAVALVLLVASALRAA